MFGAPRRGSAQRHRSGRTGGACHLPRTPLFPRFTRRRGYLIGKNSAVAQKIDLTDIVYMCILIGNAHRCAPAVRSFTIHFGYSQTAGGQTGRDRSAGPARTLQTDAIASLSIDFARNGQNQRDFVTARSRPEREITLLALIGRDKTSEFRPKNRFREIAH